MARIVSKEESKLLLKADGTWQHEGTPATHTGIKRFFHQQIRKDEDGKFFLYNAFERPEKNLTLEEHVYFEVEDTAYFVNSLKREDDAFVVELNTGMRQPLDAHALTQNAEGVVYATLHSGDRARFSRHAMTQLEPYLEGDGDSVFIRDGSHRVPLPKI
ncbi:MAG TPA: hypothetical protein VFB62_24320 [Polyangiaceae bacterium]|jgi:hypothetical protein|nr:hypothetical protein [Polyangiaceae bacterium]